MAGTTQYKNNWQKDHLDRINLTVPKGQKEMIQGHALARSESINSFINRAVCETIKQDQEKDKLRQQIAQIADTSGKSTEVVEYDMKIEDALAVLQQEVPNIREVFLSAKQQQQQASKPNFGITVAPGNKSNADKDNA